LITSRFTRRFLIWFLVLWALPAAGNTLNGRVVGVTDGDKIRLLGGNRQQHKIRLAGFDAP
jgi:endonuclease YncB( thermonuclease family)